MTILPEWVYRVVTGLAEYEDEHPSVRDGGICLEKLWNAVPEDVRRDASMFMAGIEAAANPKPPVLLDVSRDPQQHPRDDDGRYIDATGEDR